MIVSESMSNVYRISVTLKYEIVPDILQKALDKVLPYFDVFREFAAVAELAFSGAAPASAGRACAERVPGPLFLYDISD